MFGLASLVWDWDRLVGSTSVSLEVEAGFSRSRSLRLNWLGLELGEVWPRGCVFVDSRLVT